MLLKIQNYFASVKPVTVDGALYVLIAIFGAVMALMQSDDTYKYMNPYVCFYVKFFADIGLAGTTALKMFRSTSYSEHVADKKAGNTQVFIKQ